MSSGIESESGNQSQITGSTTSVIKTDSPGSINGSPSKKRKTSLKWTVQVREQTGQEGPLLDDGFKWRKYGMNYVLGARYSRSYYRCTHKLQGCLALKQVQRSDEDPSMLVVTYRRRHTCIQSANLLPQQSENRHDQHGRSLETIMNFQTGCHVKTEESGEEKVVLKSPSFSFPSTPLPTPSMDKQSIEKNSSSEYDDLYEFTSTSDSTDLYLDLDLNFF